MNNNIKQVYVCAPSGYASGGPEALHQFANEIKVLGYPVKMFYYGHKKNIESPRHKNYDIYDLEFITNEKELRNEKGVYFVVPETACNLLNSNYINQMTKIVWWLSVDFFFKSLKITNSNYKKYFGLKRLFKKLYEFPNLNKLKEMEGVINLPNSYYTYKFLLDNKMQPMTIVSDYLNINYTNSTTSDVIKENIIIYNPVKNGVYLEEIMDKTPTFDWVPIQGMTQSQVKDIMDKAKVYIDFGFHPGRERMPREACLAKCCLIIGKDGAAQYKEDMPIPDAYHFESIPENIDLIVNLIQACFNNYEFHYKKFKKYEDNIKQAKTRFTLEMKLFLESLK